VTYESVSMQFKKRAGSAWTSHGLTLGILATFDAADFVSKQVLARPYVTANPLTLIGSLVGRQGPYR